MPAALSQLKSSRISASKQRQHTSDIYDRKIDDLVWSGLTDLGQLSTAAWDNLSKQVRSYKLTRLILLAFYLADDEAVQPVLSASRMGLADVRRVAMLETLETTLTRIICEFKKRYQRKHEHEAYIILLACLALCERDYIDIECPLCLQEGGEDQLCSYPRPFHLWTVGKPGGLPQLLDQ